MSKQTYGQILSLMSLACFMIEIGLRYNFFWSGLYGFVMLLYVNAEIKQMKPCKICHKVHKKGEGCR